MNLSDVLPSLIDVGVTVAAAAIALVARATTGYLRDKSEHSLVARFMERLNTLVWLAVSDVEQSLAKELRAASEDGKLTKAEKEKLKSEALRKVKEWLGPRGWREAVAIFGGGMSGVHDVLGASVEASILRAKGEGALKRK